MRVNKLKMLIMLCLLSLSLTACIKEDATQVANDAQKGLEQGWQTRISQQIYDDNNFQMSEKTKKAQKKLIEASNKLAKKQVTDNKFKDFFSIQLCSKDYYDKLQNDVLAAEQAYNNAKASDMTFINSTNGDYKMKGVVGTFNLINILYLLLGIIPIVIIFMLLRKKKVPQVAEPAPQEVVNEPVKSNRLAVDYPKLLKEDCNTLSLEYNKVLEDFNDDAEKAYETLHVQVLQKQYNSEG